MMILFALSMVNGTTKYVKAHHKLCRTPPQNESKQSQNTIQNSKLNPHSKQKSITFTAKIFFCTHTNTLH